jgi:hypothetical protein
VKGALNPIESNIPIGTPSKSIGLRHLVQVQAKSTTSTYGFSGSESYDQLGEFKAEGTDPRNDDIDEDSSNCN